MNEVEDGDGVFAEIGGFTIKCESMNEVEDGDGVFAKIGGFTIKCEGRSATGTTVSVDGKELPVRKITLVAEVGEPWQVTMEL